jgi:hypothetical protein
VEPLRLLGDLAAGAAGVLALSLRRGFFVRGGPVFRKNARKMGKLRKTPNSFSAILRHFEGQRALWKN